MGGGEFGGHVVERGLAAAGRETLGASDKVSPYLSGKAFHEHLTSDSILDKTIGETSIEIIPSPDCADRLDWGNGIISTETIDIQHFQRTSPEGADEIAAIGGNLLLEYRLSILYPEQRAEILMASPHHIGQSEIFPNGIADVPQVLHMRRTEIDIVI